MCVKKNARFAREYKFNPLSSIHTPCTFGMTGSRRRTRHVSFTALRPCAACGEPELRHAAPATPPLLTPPTPPTHRPNLRSSCTFTLRPRMHGVPGGRPSLLLFGAFSHVVGRVRQARPRTSLAFPWSHRRCYRRNRACPSLWRRRPRDGAPAKPLPGALWVCRCSGASHCASSLEEARTCNSPSVNGRLHRPHPRQQL